MYQSAIVHLKNKYPSHKIQANEDTVDVYAPNGDHVVALRKNGAGQWQDVSEKLGCIDRWCSAPIPKDSRCFKLYRNGKIDKAEEYDVRVKESEKLARAYGGKIPSEKLLEDERLLEGYAGDKEKYEEKLAEFKKEHRCNPNKSKVVAPNK